MKRMLARPPLLRPLLKRYAGSYLLGLLTLFIVDYVNLFIPQLMGDVTDGLAAHTMDADGVWTMAVQIVLCGVVVAVGRFFWRYFLIGTSRKIEREMRNRMFEKLETLSQRYYHAHKTGDLMSYFTNDLEAVRQAIGPEIVSSFDAVVLTIMVLYRMMTYVSVELTLWCLIPMGIIAVFGYFFGQTVERRYLGMQRAFAALSDRVQESLSGERIIKAFVQEDREAAAFRKVNEDKRRATMEVVKLEVSFRPLLRLLVGVTVVIAIVVGGRLTMIGAMTLGKFVAFNMYIGSLVWPMLALGDSITYISQGIAGMNRIHEIFDEKPDITDAAELDAVTELRGGIDVSHVSFAFREDLRESLHDLNLHVEPGETLAVMGRTGSGKTALVSLLTRTYDIQHGSISFDGHDIKRIPLRLLRESIAYVPQDNFLFSNTLANNISFGRLDATREDIVKAAVAADIHDNIMDFPEQYDTMVGERGVTLSGGQKQRSSIARALLKDSPIMILDDSLSAVDTDTEETILRNLKETRAGKTTIMIAHRVSTVVNADHILVLDEGRTVEYGTPAELMAIEGGVFRTMVEKQRLERQLALVD